MLAGFFMFMPFPSLSIYDSIKLILGLPITVIKVVLFQWRDF